MSTGRPDPAWRSRDELLVLHAVRLGGFADTTAVAERADLPADVLRDTLRALEGQGSIERMTFADTAGWILTEAGRSHDADLLREEIEASGGRSLLQHTVDDFETVNPRLVRVVTDWQLDSSAGRAGRRAEVLEELTELGGALSGLMTELVGRLPRFGRYPRQFSAALDKARAGDDQWVAGVGRLSCHTVWAELHQDLLSSLGRDRSAGPGQGGR